jgi:hypothetical protein
LTTFGQWQQRLGPGLAGIGIGRQPSGIIPTVGEDLRAQNARKRAQRAALAAGTGPGAPPPPPSATPPSAVGASVPSPGA